MLHPELETPTKNDQSSIGPAPKLDLAIPDLSLRDPEDGSDDVTTPPKVSDSGPSASPAVPIERGLPVITSALRYEPKQLWPSPQMQLRGFSIAKVGAPAVAPTLSVSNERKWDCVAPDRIQIASVSDETHNESGAEVFERNSAAANVERAAALRCLSDDTGYASDLESNTGTFTTSASTARTSISGPSSSIRGICGLSRSSTMNTKSSACSKVASRSAGAIVQSSKRTLADVGILPPDQGFSQDEVDRARESTIAHSELSHGVEQHVEQGLRKIPQNEPPPEALGGVSNTCDADSEDDGPPTASMGPRAVWDEARADRNRRYAALKSISTDKGRSTDEDSDFGSELAFSPHLTNVPLPVNGAGQNPKELNASDRNFRLGQKPFLLRRIPPKRNLRATKKHTPSDPDRFATIKMQTSNDNEFPKGASGILKPTRYISIDEYMNDRELRLGLHRSKAEVVLYDPEDMGNPGFTMNQFVISSRLDPNDPFENAVINAPYARRAQLDRLNSNGNHITLAGHQETENEADANQAEVAVSNRVDAAKDGVSSMNEAVVPLKTSESDEGSNDSWKTSPDGARGRSSKRSSPSTAERRSARIQGVSSTRTARVFTSKSRHGLSFIDPIHCRPSSPDLSNASLSTGRLEQEWLESDCERLEMSTDHESEKATAHQESEDDKPSESRQRLIDVSMVERREILNKRASFERLCKFIYDLEEQKGRESESESESEEENEDEKEEYNQIEAEGGYDVAMSMFYGKSGP